MLRLKSISSSLVRLAAAAALVAAPALLLPSPVAAQSAAACAAARQKGRTLPGCPGARPARPVEKSDRRPNPPVARQQGLSAAAIAMRNSLAAVPERQWLSVDNEIFFEIERRAFAFGSFADMRALAQSGNRRAQHLIGRAYSFGQFGVGQDVVQAAEWHRRAAAAGDARSQVSLGLAYDQGSGVARNDSEAARLYSAAAAQGFAWGQFNLGVFYEDGRGVPQSYTRAMALYRQAAAQNHPSGLANIAYLYNYGRGVSQDFVQAVQWARRGADAGSAPAERLLGIILYEGRTGVRQNAADGLYWLRRAAAQDDEFARDYLRERNLSLQ